MKYLTDLPPHARFLRVAVQNATPYRREIESLDPRKTGVGGGYGIALAALVLVLVLAACNPRPRLGWEGRDNCGHVPGQPLSTTPECH